MTKRQQQIAAGLNRIDPRLAAHFKSFARLARLTSDPLSIKWAANAARSLGNLLPRALNIAQPNTQLDERMRRLADDWIGLPEPAGARIPSAGERDGARQSVVEIEIDLYLRTKLAFIELGAAKPRHRDILHAIVRALDPYGDPSIARNLAPVIDRWLQLHNRFVRLSKYEGQVEALKGRRAAFRRDCLQFEKTLHAIVARFHETLPDLRAVVATDPTKPGVVDDALAFIKKAEHYRRFFLALEDPRWLDPLERAGYFQAPPENVREGNLIHFPPWPESQYLVKVAGAAPDRVARIICRLAPTENNSVREDLVRAALAMRTAEGATLVPFFVRWLGKPVYLRLPGLLADLAEKLAQGRNTELALRLLGALLNFSRPTGRPGPLGRRVVPRMAGWVRYHDVFRGPVETLARVDGLATLHLLGSNLSRAIRWERGRRALKDDFSWIWRESLRKEPDSGDDFKEHLADAVLRVGRILVRDQALQPDDIFRELGQWELLIFRRIELELLCQVDDRLRGRARQVLLDREMFEDIRLRREYEELLTAWWAALRPADRRAWLALVRAGPSDVEALRRRLHPVGADDGEVRRYIKRWRVQALRPIAGHLTGRDRALFNRLVDEVGRPREPGSRVEVGVGPTSPQADLRSIAPEGVIDYLRTWQPSGEWNAPSREGLGREFADLVKADPEGWSARATALTQGVDPTYVRPFLHALGDAIRSGHAVQWEPVLELCSWSVAQPNDFQSPRAEEDDADWSGVRKAVARLLEQGLGTGQIVPFGERDRVWRILEILAVDPDPTAEAEADFCKGDPGEAMTLAINSVRGEAIHAVMGYAFWLVRRQENGAPRTQSWLDEMPEVRDVLSAKLAPNGDRSGAVRAAIGGHLPGLHHLDALWVGAHVDELFPSGEEQRYLRDAAWEAYLRLARVHRETVHALAGEYERACQALGSPDTTNRDPREAENSLAEHLVLICGYDDDRQLARSLHDEFFGNASPELRAHAFWFLGRHALDEGDRLPAATVERLMEVVEGRLRAAHPDPVAAATELTNLGMLFDGTCWPDEWLLDVAHRALELTSGRLQPDLDVANRIALLAPRHPVEAVRALGAVARGRIEPWGIHAWREPARRILSAAMEAGGDAREAAVAVIDAFSERGYADFEDLLSGH